MTVELRAGALRLAVRPDLGGAVAGFWHRTTPIFRSTEPADLVQARAGAMYPLLPYSNRLGHRHFRWKGHDYKVRANVADSPHALHGIGWQRPWEIVSSNAVELVIGLEHTADDDWPFAFSARQCFEVAPESLTVRLQLTNTAGMEQPVGLGWHPYFPKRTHSRLQIEVSDRWDADATKLPTRKVAQPGIDSELSHLDFDHCFEGWHGPAHIRDERFLLQLSSALPYLVVYAPPDKAFFCVEPVSHVNNAIHMAEPAAHGLVGLAPGATLEASMRLDVSAT